MGKNLAHRARRRLDPSQLARNRGRLASRAQLDKLMRERPGSAPTPPPPVPLHLMASQRKDKPVTCGNAAGSDSPDEGSAAGDAASLHEY
jgi:hypothetical protein